MFKRKYGDKAKLLSTDTDSLTYEIETKDVYEDFEKIKTNLISVVIQRIVMTKQIP